uniref:NFKB inhibitor interacting Ras-like 1 n=1 Tax=Rattus norvegicus TaxID=10116 RepID=F7FHT8_RAT
MGGVRQKQPAASGCSPLALSSAPEPLRLRKVRGGELACAIGAGPEEADRGRAPEGRLRTALTRVPLSHYPAVSGMEDCETLEDVYMASVETDRGVKEQLHLYDTRGLQEGVELPKHYFSFADGFVLVYSVNNLESFQRVELLKKEIDKFKDKKEVAIVVLGNKLDLSEQRQVDADAAQQWARSEKVKLWEVTVTDRRTLIEPFTLLASKLSQPQSKSSFPLPGRKNKGNSNSEN